EEEFAGGGAVSDGGGVVESEDDGQVERVGAVGEGFVELAVYAEGFEGGRTPAKWRGERVVADGAGVRRGLFVDEQVWVGGVGPVLVAVGQPVGEQAVGELVERPGESGDGQALVAQVDVVELEVADGFGAGGVHGGQGEGKPGGGGGRGLRGV